MKRDPKRLARLIRAQDSLARLLDTQLLAQEAALRQLAIKYRAMEASTQLIPVAFLPSALRSLVEAEANQKAVEQSAANLRQQRLAAEGRRRTVSAQLDIAEAERARMAEQEGVLESTFVMAKASGKHSMVK